MMQRVIILIFDWSQRDTQAILAKTHTVFGGQYTRKTVSGFQNSTSWPANLPRQFLFPIL
jgi:hypothetical protein